MKKIMYILRKKNSYSKFFVHNAYVDDSCYGK